MDKKLFCARLAEYAAKDPKRFLQLDGEYRPGWGGDDCDPPADEDGDWVSAGGTVELIDGATVRILIPDGADLTIVIRQLKKLRKWLKQDPNLMRLAKPRPEVEYRDDIIF